MPLYLVGLPLEILSEITSWIYVWEELLPLILTGDSLLASKLRSGGLRTVGLSAHGTNCGLYQWLDSCLLEEATVDAGYDVVGAREIINHLPSNLRCLKVVVSLDTFFIDTYNLDLSLGSIATAPTAFTPWHVASLFPHLRSLRLVHYPSREEGEDDPFLPSFWRSFFLGLPRTLSQLQISSTHIPIVDWSALPPSLASLQCHVYGSLAVPTTLCDSLVTLKVDLVKPLPSPPLLGIRPDEAQLRAWTIQNIESFVCPPNLTYLSLRCPSTTLPRSSLPSTLTHLKWTVVSTSDKFDLFQLLVFIPSSITRLKVQAINTHTIALRSAVCSPVSLPHRFLKLKSFQLFSLDVSDLEQEAWLSTLLRAMPSLESLNIGQLDVGLLPHHLELLNPSLRHLSAKCDRSCFEVVDGKTYFQKALPALEKLDLNHAGKTWSDQIISSLPKTLTKLAIYKAPITTDDLLRMPPKLTKLSAARVSVLCNENLEKLLIPPPSQTIKPASSSTADFASSTTDDSEKPFVFELGTSYGLQLIEQGEEVTGATRRHWLSPDRHTVVLRWPTPISLPFVTRMRLTRSFVPIISATNFVPSAFPLLTSLKIDTMLSTLQLGSFEKIETLSIRNIARDSVSTCPPNLMSLKMNCAIPTSFLPLSQSLTSLRIPNGPAPEGFVLPPNLQEFGVSSPGSSAKEDSYFLGFLNAPHPKLQSLIIGDFLEADEIVKSIQLNFPSLTQVKICGETTFSNVKRLRDALAPHVKIKGGCLELHNLGELALHGGFELGSIRPCRGKWIGNFIDVAAARVLPGYDYNFKCTGSFFDTASWAQFAPFLARDLTSLFFGTQGIGDCPANFAELMPPSITSLKLGQLVAGLNLSTMANLRLVEVSVFHHTLDLEFVSSLPRSLTILSLTGSCDWTVPLVQALPPGLLQLSTPGRFRNFSIESLPPSLVYLSAWNYTLARKHLPSLPPTLRFFRGFVSRELALHLLSPTYSGTLTWVTRKHSLELAVKLLDDDPTGLYDFVAHLSRV